MFKARTKIEPLAAALVQRVSVSRFCVEYDATANGAKRGGTKVKWAIEVFPRQDAGVEGCLMYEVKSQLRLGQELVPHVAGKSGINDI